MSEDDVMSGAMGSSNQTPPDSFDSWNAFWTAQGMAWRTEPEIDAERQAYLAERRAIRPDIEHGLYPFRDASGPLALDRADVEWLLAMHESDGIRGPVDWSDAKQWKRDGLDLRGAELRRIDLSELPLARVQAGLGPEEWHAFGPEERDLAAAHLEGARFRLAHLEQASLIWTYLQEANFYRAHLEGADLRDAHAVRAVFREAHLEGASLVATHLEGANLRLAHLEGMPVPLHASGDAHSPVGTPTSALPPANLRAVFFDTATALDGATLGSRQYGFVSIADARWGGANLAVVRWQEVTTLGDEQQARQKRGATRRTSGRAARLTGFEVAVRANRQLSMALREQGLNEDADRFAYRAQTCQRAVLRRQRRPLRFLGSLLLDALAGYGYRPMRAFAAYALVIALFTGLYLLNAQFVAPHLSWNEALVLSVSSFHGRGFFNTNIQLGDTYAQLAAVEAFVGLLIEITFIATFTQRFFAR